MKLFKVNGRRIAAKTIADAVEAYKAKRIDLDDASASGTADLTKIINEWLGRIQKTGDYNIDEKVDVNGNRVKGTIRLVWNGGPRMSFDPKGTGTFAVFKGGSQIDIPYDRKNFTARQGDINKAVGQIFELSDKINERRSAGGNEKPKLVGYKLEYIEGEQTGTRKRMLNKLVDFDDMVRFLIKEGDAFRASGKSGYDKAYIDVIYSIGGKKYRVHGPRFNVGDGDVRNTLKREIGFAEREIEYFRKTGYSNFVKESDSIKDALPYAESVDELTAILNRILKEKNPVNIHETINIYGKGKNSPAKIGVIAYRGKLLISAEPFGGKAYEKDLPYDFNTKTVKKEDVNKIVGPLFRDSGEKVKDFSSVEFEKLLASERQAVEDYREAISQTTDAKLLTVLSHILKEETEHIEELEAARRGVYEDKGLMDAEVLTRQERIRFVEKLTAGLQKSPYNYDKMTANEIAIKRADALDPQWRARWGGDIEAQVRQELRNTAPKDSVRDANYLRTPRGTFELVNESEEMLRHKGWGMWFEHEADGKFYRIMHDPKTQNAVAVFVRNV